MTCALLWWLVRESDHARVLARGVRARRGGLAQLLLDAAEPGLGAAGDGHLARPHHFLDAEGPEELEHGLDLGFLAGDLEGVAGRGDVDDLGAENIRDAEDLRARARLCVDADEEHL